MPGVGLMVRVPGLGSQVLSSNHAQLLNWQNECQHAGILCPGVVTRPGLCPIAKESALAAPMLCTEYGPNGWMDGVKLLTWKCVEMSKWLNRCVLIFGEPIQ